MAYDIDRKSAYIPNEEVCEEFVRAVTIGKHTEIARLIQNSERLLEATLNMDVEIFFWSELTMMRRTRSILAR